MSSAGVGGIWSTVSVSAASVYQEVLEPAMLSSAEELYGDPDFLFQQDLAPAQRACAQMASQVT